MKMWISAKYWIVTPAYTFPVVRIAAIAATVIAVSFMMHLLGSPDYWTVWQRSRGRRRADALPELISIPLAGS
jgi:hypothetical protein